MRVKLLSLLTIAGMFTLGYVVGGTQSTAVLANTERLYNKIKVLTSIIETIQRVYVEEKDADELIEAAVKGLLSNLDPHTTYLPADDFKSWNQNFEGYTGIGISFEILDGQVMIMSTLEGGPAARNGLHPGDRILEINGQPTKGLQREEVARNLMGPVGTSVVIKVASENWRAPKTLTLVRKRILLDSVPRALIIKDDIGYVKIERFTGSTASELDRALDRLEALGMRKLILDLRGNSGGYLNSAIEVADRFIPGGKKLLTTRGRLPSSYQEYYSTVEPTRRSYPLIVLIDHGSASAAEIVAGAIQDLDRGLLVGKASFGKGLVQSQYRFHDGSALLITTAKYYTPSGRAIQRDYYEKTKDDYYREAYDDALRSPDVMRQAYPKFKTVTGRTVYGGGGIIPDIHVNTRDNQLSRNLQLLLFDEDRHFYNFCRRYYEAHPEIGKSKKRFLRTFRVSNETLRRFITFIKRYDFEYDDVDFSQDYDDIRFLLKRELAYIVWDADTRFRVNMARDHELLQALKYFSRAEGLLLSAGYGSSSRN